MDPIYKLVSAGLRAQASVSHPDADLLSAFVENSLARRQRDQVIAHLADCSECREVLYRSLPEIDQAQTVLAFGRNRARWFRVRWATLVALVGIMTAIVTVRYRFLTTPKPSSAPAAAQSLSTYAQVAQETAPPETERTRSSSSEGTKAAPLPRGKARPEVKAMHAKPAARLDFDQSGQVHLRPRQSQPGPGAASQGVEPVVWPDNVVAALSENGKKTGQANGLVAPTDNLEKFARLNQGGPMGGPVKIRSASAGVAGEKGEARTVTLKDGTVTTSVRTERMPLPPAPQVFAGTMPFPPAPQVFAWTLSPEGAVLRSSDEGKTWQSVPSLQDGPFVALSSVGSHVWVGGKNCPLYHSADSGQSWHEVVPVVADRKLKTNVTRIEFSNPLNGVVSTADGESWSTGDGGLTWRHN